MVAMDGLIGSGSACWTGMPLPDEVERADLCRDRVVSVLPPVGATVEPLKAPLLIGEWDRSLDRAADAAERPFEVES